MNDLNNKKFFFYLFSFLALISCFLIMQGINESASKYFTGSHLLPPNYSKSKHSAQKVNILNGKYHYWYKFKDHKNILKVWTWQYDERTTDESISQFGVPISFLKRYRMTPQIIKKRNKQMQDGLFEKNGNILKPDLCAMTVYYMKIMNPLYRIIEETAKKENLDKRERIELLMRFCQDIPYGIPPDRYHKKYISGVYPPPLLVNEGWGDCDSKAVLFASVLSQDEHYNMAFIETPGHMLLGIEGIPRAYENYVSYRGRKYIYCEPVGPRRRPFGASNEDYRKIIDIEPIEIEDRDRHLAKRSSLDSIATFTNAGYTYKMRIIVNKKVIHKKLKILVSSSSHKRNFYEIEGMPDKNGVYSYGTEKNGIYIWLEKPGHYINLYVPMRVGQKKKEIDFHLDKGRCMFIKTKPKATLNIYKKMRNGKFLGRGYQADSYGIIRLICDAGEYDITSTKYLSGKTVKFDYLNNVPAYIEKY